MVISDAPQDMMDAAIVAKRYPCTSGGTSFGFQKSKQLAYMYQTGQTTIKSTNHESNKKEQKYLSSTVQSSTTHQMLLFEDTPLHSTTTISNGREVRKF
ncbi:unnamed protein product [Caenorhabditis nigoni]